jgi:hypothetical protein
VKDDGTHKNHRRHRTTEKYIDTLLVSIKSRDHLKALVTDGKILKWILEKQECQCGD